MCGIAGMMGSRCPVDSRDRVEAAVAHLHHRGPDGQGIAPLPSGWIGATRLAMVGDRRETVPIVLDGASSVVGFNGEVYSADDGTTWQGQTGASDARRLAERIEQRGLMAALADLDADLALARWSGDGGELALARDLWGRRPLYYWWRPGLLAFASDLRSFDLLLPDELPRQTAERVAVYLGNRGMGPTATPLHGVDGVPAGAILRWDADAARPPRREDLPDPGSQTGLSLADAIEMAARSRLADRAPSLLLSGGVDSTLLAEALESAVDDLDLLTWTHRGQDDERAHAQATARRLGRRLRPVTVDAHAFVEATIALAQTTGHPPVDPSEPVIALLAQASASRSIMMGEGADELFGGYRYLHRQLADLEARFGRRPVPDDAIERVFGDSRSHWAPPEVMTLLEDASPATLADARTLASEGRRRFALGAGELDTSSWSGRAARLTELYLGVHLPDLLLRADRATMSAGREARLPFLASCVTTTVLGAAPGELRELMLGPRVVDVGPNDSTLPLGKSALRSLLSDPSVARRPKIGFRLPVSSWLRDELPTVLDVVHAGLGRGGVVDPDRAVAVVEHDLSRERDGGPRAFTLLALAATMA